MTYYLEVVCVLAIFGKTDLWLELDGNTDDHLDQGVDSFYRSFTYIMAQMSAGNMTLKVKKRGYYPLGGGQIILRQQYSRKIEAVSLMDEGKVKRVRGWVTSAKVSP